MEESGKFIFELFGSPYLKSKPLIYPDHIYSGITYKGTETDGDYLVFRMAQVMDISSRSIETEYTDEDSYNKVLSSFPFAPTQHTSAAGTFTDHSDHIHDVFKISLRRSLLKQPDKLIAVIIHEMSHIKLLGEGRMSENDEELTDLLPVFFGLGIFSANGVTPSTSSGGVSKLGYLPPSIFGYTLALWVHYKKVDHKPLLPFLSTTVKDVFKKTLRYIQDNAYSYWIDSPEGEEYPDTIKIIKFPHPPKKIGGSESYF